jgi:plastocyanin
VAAPAGNDDVDVPTVEMRQQHRHAEIGLVRSEDPRYYYEAVVVGCAVLKPASIEPLQSVIDNSNNIAAGTTTTEPVTANNGSSSNSNDAAANTGVSIVSGASTLTDSAFQPDPVNVDILSTVTWTNDDAQPHTATSGENAAPDGIFDSSILAAGKSFSYTFAEAGEYRTTACFIQTWLE